MRRSRPSMAPLPDRERRPVPARARVEGHEQLLLSDGWRAGPCAPDAHLDPRGIEGLEWLAAGVPGTAALALYRAGRWLPGQASDLDAEDWWFNTSFQAAPAAAGEEVVLELDGIATAAEVFLNGEPVLTSDSMFARHCLDVGSLLDDGGNELAIRCRALAPLLRERRKPRARWRTRLVDGNLRFHRTMLLGRAPGFAADPAAVGPWRQVRLVRRSVLALEQLRLEPSLDGASPGADGVLSISASLRALGGHSIDAVELQLEGPSGAHRCALALAHSTTSTAAEGSLRVPAVARWWPHTHGEPALHEARLQVATSSGAVTVELGRAGFRTVAAGASPEHELERDGLDLHVNGVAVFARGAVWTPIDPIGLAPNKEALRAALERVRDAGMNMLRIPGTSVYESQDFHDLCDDLGLLVWQDFMFANLDYPIGDEGFRATVRREAEEVLAAVAGRPSLAVLCGNSEVEQQVAMLGLDPALGRGELFGELLPGAVERAPTDAVYVPSAPCGGTLPFRPDRGIANYYGVGGYRRPLEDARRAEVRFAAECLAFSNVPDEDGVRAVAGEEIVVHDPRWKAGVPRDAGTGWDFEDVRDHYLAELYGVEPSELRRVDHARYLELSRAVTGEAMAEVFGEWRREGSPCQGGLVLWLTDLAPGAGWGVIDAAGRPKPAYHHLRRVLSPVAVWMTDEGLAGIHVHVANDRAAPLAIRLRVALYREGERLLTQAEEQLELPAHSSTERDIEEMLGHFADVSWAYRFGPAEHDVVVASLEQTGADELEPISQAFRFPEGRPLRQQSPAELGLGGILRGEEGGDMELELTTRRLAYGVRIHAPGLHPSDDALILEPGVARRLTLSSVGPRPDSPGGSLTALNMRGAVRLARAGHDG
jgi:beta-mannosidase